jgi:hypothetical protein
MKNQNPQDILNEILLRMKYDMSKTLTENKVLVEQMSDYYYDQFGNLKLEPVNKTKMPASQLYPEIKNGQYPKTVTDYTKRSAINTWYSTASLRNAIKQPKIQTRQEANAQKLKQSLPQNFGKPREGAVSPYNYTPTYYPSYRKNQEVSDYTSWYNNYTNVAPWQRNFIEEDKPKSTEEVKAFQDFLDDNYPTWYLSGKLNKGQGYGTFGPNTTKAWYQNEKVRTDWFNKKNSYLTTTGKSKLEFYKPQRQVSYRDATTVVKPQVLSPEELKSNKEFADKIAKSQTRVEIYAASGEYEIPADATTEFWTYDDVSSFDKFKKNIIDKDNSAALLYTTKPPFFTKPTVKSFTVPIKGVNIKFKEVINGGTYSGFGTLDQEGYLIYYDKWSFFNKTTWEDWGPTLLNAGSLVLALLPATWPLLLISAGMDLYAAKMQYEQGETEGAKVSALLALTPFVGKLGIKVSPTVSKNLMKKFANATTEQEVSNIVKTLSKEEQGVLQSLRELGDLKSEVKEITKSKEVSDAINKAAKDVPGIGKTALKKAGLEMSLAGGVLFSKWDEMEEEILAQMTNKELISDYIDILKSMTEDQELKNKFEDVKNKLEKNTTKFVGNLLKKIIDDAEAAKKLSLEKSKTEIDKMNNYLMQSKQSTDSKIGKENAKNLIDTVVSLGRGRGEIESDTETLNK